MSHCGRIYFTVNESTLNFCNLLFSSFKKWHFKLEINRGNSLNFNDNTMSVQNEHIARQARFLIKSLTTEIMWPSYKSRSIFCPLFWWPETWLIRREIRYIVLLPSEEKPATALNTCVHTFILQTMQCSVERLTAKPRCTWTSRKMREDTNLHKLPLYMNPVSWYVEREKKLEEEQVLGVEHTQHHHQTGYNTSVKSRKQQSECLIGLISLINNNNWGVKNSADYQILI